MGRFKTFDEFLDLFPARPRLKIKGGYNVLCPAHDDHDPSLSISLNNHKILLNCKAGCQNPQILAALNLSQSDLFLNDSQTPTIVATYPYQDESGKPLYEIVRYHPKTFKMRKPDGKGGWAWSMEGVKKVLYHLPDIVKAPEVYFVEGEKDCDALWSCGLVATTSPGGSQAWKAEYGECLAGKRVILIPDNDEAGYAYARDIACSLMGKAEPSCILLPDKDVSEWLAQNHRPDELKPMEQDISILLGERQLKYEIQDEAIIWQHNQLTFRAENLRLEKTGLHGRATILNNYTPLAWSVFNLERTEERTKLAKSAFKELKPDTKKGYTLDAIGRDLDLFCAGLWNFKLSSYSPELVYGNETPLPLVFMLYPYILQGGGTILFSPPGKGKSITALLWAQSINQGVSTYWEVNKSPVLYINLERSRESIQRRLSCVNKVLGLPAVTSLRILNARGKALSDIIATCRKSIKQNNIKVIFLDSISRAGYGDLTENRPINAILDALSSLCETWVALAHTPRGDETHPYGSVMFDAGADIVVRLSSEGTNDATMGVGYEITKSNDISHKGQSVWAFEFNDNGLAGLRTAYSHEFIEIEGKAGKPTSQLAKEYILAQERAEATASEIAEATGLSRGGVANILKHSGIFVQTRKEGRNVFYGVKAQSNEK